MIDRVKYLAGKKRWYLKYRDEVLRQRKVRYQNNRVEHLKACKEYVSKNKPKVFARRKLYREKNAARLRDEKRGYYLSNKERLLKKQQVYYQSHKQAHTEYVAKWQANNRHKVNGYIRNWRTKNIDRVRAKQKITGKLYNRVHAKERAEYSKQYVKRFAAKVAASKADYRHRNREKVYAWNANRRILIGPDTRNPQIIEMVYQLKASKDTKCYYCGIPISGKSLHIDHIIPLSRGGKHALDNLCAACQSCNSSKHNKLLSEWKPGGTLTCHTKGALI